MITLKNDRLAIEIEAPGDHYSGSRYDWSSFIASIVLDNKHQFLGVESKTLGEGNGGKGLCGEFCMDGPLGYEDAAVGDFVPKIGVGLIKKSSGEFLFCEPAQMKPLRWECSSTASTAQFSCEQDLHAGFAYRLEKKLSVHSNLLIINYLLHNTGERDIATHEYCHNFFLFNEAAAGSAYEVSMDYDPEFIEKVGNLSHANRLITFADNPEWPLFVYDQTACVGKNVSWELVHREQGLCVSETLSKPISKFAVFANSNAICPELFVDIKVHVGQSFAWQRKWDFQSGI